jgi:hypothetical protein
MTNTFYNSTLRAASLFVGENPDYVATFHTSSKRKILLYATCMMLPILLWLITSFLACRQSFGMGFLASIGSALIAGLIIYCIERTIINAKTNIYTTFLRLALGFCTAILGSVFLDEVLFKSDIDNVISSMQIENTENIKNAAGVRFNTEINAQQQSLDNAKQIWIGAAEEAKGEADGTRGSRVAQRGSITIMKQGIADQYQQDYTTQQNNMVALKAKQQAAIDAALQSHTFNEHGLLTRIKAMFTLVANDNAMLILYIIVTSFLFFIEFLVVIVKLSSPKSVNELLEEQLDALALEQHKAKMAKLAKHYKPELALQGVREIQHHAYQASGNILN